MDTTTATPIGVRLVERMLHDAFAEGDVDVVDEVCTPDLIAHQFGLSGVGAEAFAKLKRGIGAVHAAFPDLVYTIEDWSERGDIVWVRAEATATNTGPFFGPPTGMPIRFTVIDIVRVRDGRICEHWGSPDRFAILAQLGRLPAPRG